MCKAAADRASVTSLNMPNVPDRFVEQRTPLPHKIGRLDRSLPREGADHETIPKRSDVVEVFERADVYQVAWRSYSEIEQRHEALSTGDELGVLAAASEVSWPFRRCGQQHKQKAPVASLPPSYMVARGRA
jgi:hypothetical protein